jgi:hypothetical protein
VHEGLGRLEGSMAAARWAALRPALEGFVHDARNPLHALMLQLEVLRVGPGVTGRRAADMRAQLDRLRGLLECLGEVALPPEVPVQQGPGLEVRAARALGLLGWTLNRRRIRCARTLEPHTHVACADGEALEFLVGQALWHALAVVPDGGQLALCVELRGGAAWLEVRAEPHRAASAPVSPAFVEVARGWGGDAGRDAALTWLRLPAGRGA